MPSDRKGVTWKRVEGHGMVTLWPGEVLLFINNEYSGKVKLLASNEDLMGFMDSMATLEYTESLCEPEWEVFV